MSQFTNEEVITGSIDVNNFPASQNVVVTSIPEVEIKNDSGNPIPVSGTVTATGPLTDTQLRATPVPVSGTITATGPLTDSQLRATPVPVTIPTPVAVTQGGNASAAVSRVTVSTTVATLKTSNSARIRLIIYNETGTLFVKYGSAATDTDYTTRLTANTVLEIVGYTGIVTGIKLSGSSFAQVTEI